MPCTLTALDLRKGEEACMSHSIRLSLSPTTSSTATFVPATTVFCLPRWPGKNVMRNHNNPIQQHSVLRQQAPILTWPLSCPIDGVHLTLSQNRRGWQAHRRGLGLVSAVQATAQTRAHSERMRPRHSSAELQLRSAPSSEAALTKTVSPKDPGIITRRFSKPA